MSVHALSFMQHARTSGQAKLQLAVPIVMQLACTNKRLNASWHPTQYPHQANGIQGTCPDPCMRPLVQLLAVGFSPS